MKIFPRTDSGAGGRTDEGPELFLLGLVSVADTRLDRSMEGVLEDLPLAPEIAMTLRGGAGEFRGVYDLTVARNVEFREQGGETDEN